jgi:DNA-binding CsgD family transcriptional regulator
MLPKDLVHYQMYTYFWEEALPHSSLSLACERHSLYHGITLMYRYKGYYDMASFAMPEERSFANSYYLSSLLLLQQFYEAFLGKYKRLIKSLDSCKIHLPFEKQDENLTKLVLNNQKGRYEISGYNGNTYLTSIEIMCINLLNSGNSYKTIAGILDISVRTVETYLTRAKLRAGYINMTDLIKSLNSVNTFM